MAGAECTLHLCLDWRRFLGLGDIGANGMGIPIGKLQLYTACAAVQPDVMLPILFDIGTANPQLRADPLYLGLREPPPSDEELDSLTEEFVQSVRRGFPACCIHFEDWKGTDAIRMPDPTKARYCATMTTSRALPASCWHD